jgi:hypothetical protein
MSRTRPAGLEGTSVDERVAIAEIDDGLPRAVAKRLAGREIGISPLAPQCRIARVEFFGAGRAYYQLCKDGPAFAVIVPVIEFGDTIDFAAIDLETQHVATLLGIGKALGLDNIDRARWNGGTLTLLDKPLDWLRSPVAAACIIDWKVAAFTLADLDRPVTTLTDRPISLRCSSPALAERIARAFARPLPIPHLHVRAA